MVTRQDGRENGSEPILGFFTAIARQEGWEPGGELEAHRSRSTYFALTNADENITGGLQLVAPDERGQLPTTTVWPELAQTLAASKGTIAHVFMLAVSKTSRSKRDGGGNSAFWQLTAAMWNHCVQHGIMQLWLEATPRTLRAYKLVGWPLTVRGELRDHWGEPCYPCSLSICEVAGVLAQRAVRSDTYRRILTEMVREHGTGKGAPLL